MVLIVKFDIELNREPHLVFLEAIKKIDTKLKTLNIVEMGSKNLVDTFIEKITSSQKAIMKQMPKNA